MGELTAAEQFLVEYAASAPMLDQVQNWAAINSGSGNLDGLNAMARLLADAFAGLPGQPQLVEPAPVTAIDREGAERAVGNGRHLHLAVRPSAPLQLLFTGHMDTVYPADHPFQQLAWREDDILNGPGVADMKGGIAVMLAALRALEASPLSARVGYEVVINSDEEVGSPASAGLLAQAARGKRAALTYEPSALPDGTLAGARPGSGNFSFIVSGRSAHAGRNPQDGRNAVVAAADLALRLTALIEPGLTVNVARMDGGGPNNVVPDHAVLRVNLRPATPELQAKADSAITDAVTSVATSHDVAIHRHGAFGRPPKPMTPSLEQLFGLVARAGADLGQPISWQPSGGVCDGNNIAACGVPVVDTMGVRGGAIHSAEEYLIVSSLAERAALSALTIARLAQEAA
ncbi:hydrolase [Sphingomonas sp. KRR8]|uniref:hydrolase n=1 Tax=Sphingomonas sp. KRR8 TaxID=2942996 RepID=UPI0020208C5A|nr:hydrolase [Sphingomonas sp. KRR8]URD61177.1 hydrolase [Sphingomonas sp. KRR8]